MSDVSASPSDPVFWMHHSFIDHSYRIWQNADYPARVQSINGVDVNGNALNLNYEIAVGGIMPNVKLGDIINTLGGVVIGGVPFCYRYNY
jgi:tyrosinase